MFFSKKITTIFISPNNIDVAVFSTWGKKIKEEKRYGWTQNSLEEVLKEIAKYGSKTARVVFREDVSYVVALENTKKERESILDEAREHIPEKIEHNWDFRIRKHPTRITQVAAVKREFFESTIDALNKAGFSVQSCEPQSIALARTLPTRGSFVYVSKNDEQVLFCAVNDHCVVFTQTVGEENLVEAFNHFMPFIKKRFAQLPATIFLGKGLDSESEVFLQFGIRLESLDLDPLKAAALKKDMEGSDASVLNIRTKNATYSDKSDQIKKFDLSGSEKMLALVFISLILICVFLAAYKYF